MAYIFNNKNFYGRDFFIDDSVLIPRPESEAIIDIAKTLDLPTFAHILDVGTGSGCLAISLALEFPQASVVGVDISDAALDTATFNDKVHEGRVNFLYSDLLSTVDPKEHGAFDLVVANLPYVNPDWDWLDPKALSFEPELALYPKHGSIENGLSDYHRLFAKLIGYTKVAPVKNLILEADPCQQKELIDLAKFYHWKLRTTNGYALAFYPTTK